jgi:N-acetylglucosamine-6-phosphate deacetylase
MTVLSGVDVVLPGRIVPAGSVALDGSLIADVSTSTRPGGEDLSGYFVLPGFVDVHVHGLHGIDAMEGEGAVAAIADLMPRFGVTSFCPTSIACPPDDLRRLLAAVHRCRTSASAGARVLPAHLESNFINPEYKGAQPAWCLRSPLDGTRATSSPAAEGAFTGREILNVIAAARADVGILTIAPELEGAIELIAELVRHGHRVSLGHSGATFEEAVAGIEAGATQATHLFNRMPPLAHRAPGLAGAVLGRDELAAELICDGVHVHPAVMRMALRAKRPERIMAITDGTAGAGMPPGSASVIGGRRITVGDAAYLEDGTIAGSVLTMDQAFRLLVERVGASIPDAAMACATTPAREMGLEDCGVVAAGATADLVVLDRSLQVHRTYIGGRLAYSREHHPDGSRLSRT